MRPATVVFIIVASVVVAAALVMGFIDLSYGTENLVMQTFFPL